MIAIIDYGAGNLKSVKKAFDYLNVKCKIITSNEELKEFMASYGKLIAVDPEDIDKIEKFKEYTKLFKNNRERFEADIM